MKKLLLLLVIFTFTSCFEDDEVVVEQTTTEQTEVSIIGKWELESILVNGISSDLDLCEQQNTFEFKENSSSIQLDYYLNSTEGCTLQTPSYSEFLVESNTLFLFYTNGQEEWSFEEKILELSDTKLVLQVGRRYSGSEEGEISVVTYKRL